MSGWAADLRHPQMGRLLAGRRAKDAAASARSTALKSTDRR